MSISYFDAIKQGYPTVIAKCSGDPYDYNSLDWEGGDAIPSQDELNQWILANPGFNPTLQLTKYQFRQLFTLNEKVAVDNFKDNPAIPANYKAILTSIMKDLELSEIVYLDNPGVEQGVSLLEQLGLLATGRAAQILSNTAPA